MGIRQSLKGSLIYSVPYSRFTSTRLRALIHQIIKAEFSNQHSRDFQQAVIEIECSESVMKVLPFRYRHWYGSQIVCSSQISIAISFPGFPFLTGYSEKVRLMMT